MITAQSFKKSELLRVLGVCVGGGGGESVCVCMCVREREREGRGGGGSESKRETISQYIHSVCGWGERERVHEGGSHIVSTLMVADTEGEGWRGRRCQKGHLCRTSCKPLG